MVAVDVHSRNRANASERPLCAKSRPSAATARPVAGRAAADIVVSVADNGRGFDATPRRPRPRGSPRARKLTLLLPRPGGWEWRGWRRSRGGAGAAGELRWASVSLRC